MKLATFFAKFDQFADAPGAVAKMRELVLQLAVQGKLVEQRPKELSAKECIRKANKPLVDIVPDESTETPAGWAALQLGCLIASNTGGGTPSKQNPSYWNGSIPWASVKDVQSDKYLVATIDSITEEGLKDSSSNLIPPNRLIVVTRMGLGKLAINTISVAINQDLRAIEPTTALDLDFAYLLFKSLKMVGSGVTVKGITVDKLHAIPVVLPPLAEQKRIVAKLDELMALCDRLEAQQQERETRHAALARASLSRFAEAPTPANLDFLFHKSYTIDPADLRKSILTLAVQGKLVPQDAGDETADELLVRCLAERRKLNRSVADTVHILDADSSLGFDIPNSWRWQSLEDLLIFGPTNGISPKAVEYETPVRSLTLSATTSGRFKGEHSKFITSEVPPDSDLWLRDGDILVQRGNTFEYVGVPAIYRGKPNRFVYPDLMMKLRFSSALDAGFIHLAMSEEAARDFLRARASGTSGSMPKINQTTLKSLPLPIPPLAEQRRIVAKVDQLMALVDELETQLAASRAVAEKLLEALVAELTANGP